MTALIFITPLPVDDGHQWGKPTRGCEILPGRNVVPNIYSKNCHFKEISNKWEIITPEIPERTNCKFYNGPCVSPPITCRKKWQSGDVIINQSINQSNEQTLLNIPVNQSINQSTKRKHDKWTKPINQAINQREVLMTPSYRKTSSNGLR